MEKDLSNFSAMPEYKNGIHRVNIAVFLRRRMSDVVFVHMWNEAFPKMQFLKFTEENVNSLNLTVTHQFINNLFNENNVGFAPLTRPGLYFIFNPDTNVLKFTFNPANMQARIFNYTPAEKLATHSSILRKYISKKDLIAFFTAVVMVKYKTDAYGKVKQTVYSESEQKLILDELDRYDLYTEPDWVATFENIKEVLGLK